MLNLLDVCNKIVSSFLLMLSYGFWHFHHPYLLASSVLCIAFCSHWELCILRQYIQTRGRTSSCSPTHKPIHLPQNSHNTYLLQHYHLILHDLLSFIIYILLCMILYSWCAVYPCYARSLHILLHWQRHTVSYIMFCSLWVIRTKKCVVILECCP
jgi:hypothetical protein